MDYLKGIKFCDFSKNKKRKSHSVSAFLLLINTIVFKYPKETLISLLQVEICDMWVSISYFDHVLGKRKSQTQHVLNFTGI